MKFKWIAVLAVIVGLGPAPGAVGPAVQCPGTRLDRPGGQLTARVGRLPGGGGVFSAYIGPPDYGYVSPGSTALYDGREAGIIKAGLTRGSG